MEACAAQARLDGGARLNAIGREPRVLVLMREIVSLGDAALSGERMLMALCAFDEVQALTMAELLGRAPPPCAALWREGFCHSARAVLERARERLAAERFVEAEGAGRMGDTPAFFERAPAIDRGAGAARRARAPGGAHGAGWARAASA